MKIAKVLRFILCDFTNLPSNLIYSSALTLTALALFVEGVKLPDIITGVVLTIFTSGCSYLEITFFIIKQRVENKSLANVREEEGNEFFKMHKIVILVLVIVSILRVISPPDQTIY